MSATPNNNIAILGILALGAVVVYVIYKSEGDGEDGAPSASDSAVFGERLDKVIQDIDYAKDGTLCGFCKRELDKIKGATETLKKVAPAASWIAEEKAESPL